MTLAIGDHLVIKRNGQIVDPTKEGWHEYEVVAGIQDGEEVNYLSFPNKQTIVKLKVVE